MNTELTFREKLKGTRLGAILEERERTGWISPEERFRQWEAEQRRRAEEAQQYRHRQRLMEENIQVFYETEGLYTWDPEGRITSRELYEIYKAWCIRLNIPLQPPRAFFLHTKKNALQYRLVYSTHIPDKDGKRGRGFYGIRPLKEKTMGTDGADTEKSAVN